MLLDLTIAGSTGPLSLEALHTQVHAQVLFMMVLAQTVNPGLTCVHGGILRERAARKIWLAKRHNFLVPLYVPEDKNVVSGSREIAEKGGPGNADHTLNNVDAFFKWRQKLVAAGERKEYFPELPDTVRKERDQLKRTSRADRAAQLQEIFLVDD